MVLVVDAEMAFESYCEISAIESYAFRNSCPLASICVFRPVSADVSFTSRSRMTAE
jgi:hypothetical protein